MAKSGGVDLRSPVVLLDLTIDKGMPRFHIKILTLDWRGGCLGREASKDGAGVGLKEKN